MKEEGEKEKKGKKKKKTINETYDKRPNNIVIIIIIIIMDIFQWSKKNRKNMINKPLLLTQNYYCYYCYYYYWLYINLYTILDNTVPSKPLYIPYYSSSVFI